MSNNEEIADHNDSELAIMKEDKLAFIVKDTRTGKLYNHPGTLVSEAKLSNLRPCMFDRGSFAILGDGSINIEGNCNDIIYLDSERFKPVWNKEHPIFNKGL